MPHICEYCDKQFIELLDLAAHMIDEHKKGKKK